ncbi:alpha/beta hydrolase [Sphingopyxis lindanitolerans]|uniref:Alpha/beta hydrolase n=1 Tax=Sphingopyxis lindanitolerans TaxID=2054227 RepID=A0A2S8BB06_9SPHN|nr:alpha/beta fold hydrolase [Sphingopyxis lindanitolerans]PQM29503.1 alpha/beta hydrolase [Sphingopyxis lindanitolerans]
MSITRHFIEVKGRRVHYRKAGNGPALLMVHQSPRSSAEYDALMRRWADHFTCIAPDTPGFGQSDPLPGEPDVTSFADALVALLDALGLDRTAAYGFHSGGIILMEALQHHPARFTALATGGYAVWTPQEMAVFSESYLPAFRPSAYGEHLTWLWNRIAEQSWFFPWFDVRDETRLGGAHDDPARIDAVVREMLDSGDAYRSGYGAALSAPSAIPPADTAMPPVLIAAYDGDPLQGHIARLGELPAGWRAEAVATPSALETACLGHLRAAPSHPCPPIAEGSNGGFAPVRAAGFDGLIHWRGDPAADTVRLPAPGRAADLLPHDGTLAIDLPGHGLSDDWAGGDAPTLDDWSDVVASALGAITGGRTPVIVGEGFSALLAAAVARKMGAPGWGGIAAHLPVEGAAAADWADHAIPDGSPDRHGAYLHAAWSAVRAAHFFWPWFEAKAANAIPFVTADIAPDALAAEHRSLIRARAGRSLLATLAAADRATLIVNAPPLLRWETEDWAAGRADIWSPKSNDKGEKNEHKE